MGGSPATGPTQNLGLQAQGVQAAAALVTGLAAVLQKVGPSTDLGQAIAKAIVDIGKHIPPGSVTPQAQQTQLQQMMQRQQQMRPQIAALQRPQAPPGAPAGGPGGPPTPAAA